MVDRKNYLGFICIVIGVYAVIYTYKNPDKQLWTRTFGSYIGGTTLIIIGIMLIFGIEHL